MATISGPIPLPDKEVKPLLSSTFTTPAIVGQLEALRAGALVGPLGVLTLVGTEASWKVPALVDIYHVREVDNKDACSKLN